LPGLNCTTAPGIEVSWPAETVGTKLVRQQDLLADQMVLGLQDKDIERAITVPPRLVTRRSTAPPQSM
jgi:hypothetical protein